MLKQWGNVEHSADTLEIDVIRKKRMEELQKEDLQDKWQEKLSDMEKNLEFEGDPYSEMTLEDLEKYDWQ